MSASSKNIPIDIIIPALNEESVIGSVVQECLRLKRYKPNVYVFVDGKTTDRTANVAKKAGAIVINTKERSGKGALIRLALRYLKSKYIIQIDADHQFQPIEIPLLIEPLRHGYSLTLGTRYQKGSMVEMYSVSFLRLFGSYFLSKITSLVIHQQVTDVMAGFKAFTKETAEKLALQTNHFGYEAEIVIKTSRLNKKILNIPITYTSRPGGQSSVSSLKHGILVLYTILKFGLFTSHR